MEPGAAAPRNGLRAGDLIWPPPAVRSATGGFRAALLESLDDLVLVIQRALARSRAAE